MDRDRYAERLAATRRHNERILTLAWIIVIFFILAGVGFIAAALSVVLA